MRNIVIAEDELLVRMGIAASIPWEELGLKIAASVADGESALEACASVRPEILLTDIRMPRLGGMELIRRNYDTVNVRNQRRDMLAMQTKYPDIEDKPENYAIGSMLMHMLTAPYIEVAADGLTAQGLWYAPGQVTVAHPDGVDAMYMYERYGVDFIKEDGEWKIWHLFIGTDFALEPGTLMTEQPVDTPEFDLNDEDEDTNMILTHKFEAYTSRYNYFHYPAIPQPYETFTDKQVVSNGPEGNPRFVKYLQEA